MYRTTARKVCCCWAGGESQFLTWAVKLLAPESAFPKKRGWCSFPASNQGQCLRYAAGVNGKRKAQGKYGSHVRADGPDEDQEIF